jgi:hypothetical protein
VTCSLAEIFGQRVIFDTPGHYTPLFAFDEAVALAAGHRPCAACRRGAFERFTSCWKVAQGIEADTFVSVRDIDHELHHARFSRGHQVRHTSKVGSLPDGVFVLLCETQYQPVMLWQGYAYPWSQAGYGEPVRCRDWETATVLTPAPTVAVLVAGYRPEFSLSKRVGP